MNTTILTEIINATSNLTASEPGEDGPWSLPIRVMLTILLSSLAIVGIVGNVLVITVVLKVRGMVTPTNCYLVSLAASDCLFLAASSVSEVKYLQNLKPPSSFTWFHYASCIGTSFIPYLAINTSSLSITAFTIERYFGICDPIRASYMCTVKRAKTIILGIWIFSLVYNAPWLYLVDWKLNGTEYICDFRLTRDHTAYKVIYLFDLVTFYVIPLILYLVIYSRIGYTITKNSPKTKVANFAKLCAQDRPSMSPIVSANGCNSEQHFSISCKKSSGGMNQVVKMLGIVVVIFAICWLPYRAMVAYNSFATKKWNPEWYIFTSKTMIFINCAINPIIYNLMSAKFRGAFSKLLHTNSKALYEKATRQRKAMKMMCKTLEAENSFKDRTTSEETNLLS